MTEDGRIYVPSVRVVESPVPIGSTGAKIASREEKILSDTVHVLDPDGNTLEEIAILDALVESGWVGLFAGAHEMNGSAVTDDPTHLNDVRVVSRAVAANSDRLTPGDILVSLRSLNALGIQQSGDRRETEP